MPLLLEVMSQDLVWSQQGYPFIIIIIIGLLLFKLWKITRSGAKEVETPLATTYYPGRLDRWISALRFFVSGPSIILQGYEDVSSFVSLQVKA